jgi:hypothetical protein
MKKTRRIWISLSPTPNLVRVWMRKPVWDAELCLYCAKTRDFSHPCADPLVMCRPAARVLGFKLPTRPKDLIRHEVTLEESP